MTFDRDQPLLVKPLLVKPCWSNLAGHMFAPTASGNI
jgi:hypothetical protein